MTQSERSMLLSTHGMHSQTRGTYDDLDLIRDLVRGTLMGQGNGVVFCLKNHRPMVEYIVACQKLYADVQTVVDNFAALCQGNNLPLLIKDLQDCLAKYEKCLEVHDDIIRS